MKESQASKPTMLPVQALTSKSTTNKKLTYTRLSRRWVKWKGQVLQMQFDQK